MYIHTSTALSNMEEYHVRRKFEEIPLISGITDFVLHMVYKLPVYIADNSSK